MDFEKEYHRLDIRNDIEFEMRTALDWFMDTINPKPILLRLGMGKWGYMNYKRLMKAHNNIKYREFVVNKAIEKRVEIYCGLCVKFALLKILVDSEVAYFTGDVAYCPCCNDEYSGSATFYRFKL